MAPKILKFMRWTSIITIIVIISDILLANSAMECQQQVSMNPQLAHQRSYSPFYHLTAIRTFYYSYN